MNREELKALGLSDEVIEKIMASHGKELQSANAKAEKYKADAQLAGQYKQQLDDIQNQNLTDIEKANKATEEANNKVLQLEAEMREMKIKNDLATQGIVGEDADNLLKGLAGGSLDVVTLGKIIADRETKAMAQKEQELLNNTPNPDGAGGAGGEQKTVAEKLVSQLYEGKKDNQNNILSHYVNGGNANV